MDEKVVYYSLLSGDIYEVSSDEVKNLDMFQLPLTKRPNSSCNKCHGRGYVGFEINRKYFPMCKCVIKVLDRSKNQQQG